MIFRCGKMRMFGMLKNYTHKCEEKYDIWIRESEYICSGERWEQS